MSRLVGVRLKSGGHVCGCDSGDLDLKSGDRVIIKTEDGSFFGEVICLPQNLAWREEVESAGAVDRLATADDLAAAQECLHLEKEAFTFCQERILTRQMTMRLVAVERLFDGSKMIFYFTADGRVDFRALVKDLASRFRCRVEMRQIGVRNETKLLGGLGSCGRELCCATFMRQFTPVSVKMAKEQNLSLNPNKISGLCGRLMCCLAYEFPVYMEHKKDMAKVGKRVITPEGEGKVVRQNVMAGRVTVCVGDKEIEFPSEAVKQFAPSPRKKDPGRERQ